uniref:Uncharacterized protein n=1 Tax=Romanomermis culicivorax TaxID=13658 RepID=A0A915IU58_ROMCU
MSGTKVSGGFDVTMPGAWTRGYKLGQRVADFVIGASFETTKRKGLTEKTIPEQKKEHLLLGKKILEGEINK